MRITALVCVAALSAIVLLLAAQSERRVLLVEVPPMSVQQRAEDHSISDFDKTKRASIGSEAVQRAAVFAFVRINQDRVSCGLSPYTEFNVWSAKSQLTDGVTYTLQMHVLGLDEEEFPPQQPPQDYNHPVQIVQSPSANFHVQIEHLLPAAFHPVHTSENNDGTSPLFAQYQIKVLSPSPCREAEDFPPPLVPQQEKDKKQSGSRLLEQPAHLINADPSSAWQATVYPEFAQLTTDEFRAQKLGFIPPPAHLLKKKTSKLSQELAAKLPASFDARDHIGNCKAFRVQDQGNCGSCFAFASASALSQRLCMGSHLRFDVNISPQDILSCYSDSACSEGGLPLLVYEKMYVEGKVGDWCAPYEAKDPSMGMTCGQGVCQEGIRFHALNESLGWIADSAEDMMEEILFHGPVAVGFAVHSDFPMYRGGVYKVSKQAKKNIMGGHAVVIIGWGVDPKEGPYWLCQNSWSKAWGENGFFRIARGRNEALIEEYGAFFALPKVPEICPPPASCKNGGELTQDCSCRCFDNWQGDSCEKCGIDCKMGAVNNEKCTCECYPGYEGEHCDDLFTIQRAFTCMGRPSQLVWNLQHRHIAVGSYVQLFPREIEKPWDEDTNTWQPGATLPLFLCGTKEAWSSKNKHCDTSGSLVFPNLPPGSYNAFFVEFLGKNEFGVPRGYKRPERLTPTIRIADNCNDVMAMRFEAAKEALIEEKAREESAAAHVRRQIARLRSAISYISAHDGPLLHAKIRAFPSVAFVQAHVYVHLRDGEEGLIRICPADISTNGFFRHTMPVAEPDCRIVGKVQGGSFGNNAHDLITVGVDDMTPGVSVAELLVNGRILSASELTIAHVSMRVVQTEKSADGSALRVWISWKVEPALAASDKDWVAIYAQDVQGHVAGFFTSGSEVRELPAKPEGDVELLLQAGEHGAMPGMSYTVLFMPAGSSEPAAADTFQWES